MVGVLRKIAEHASPASAILYGVRNEDIDRWQSANRLGATPRSPPSIARDMA